MASGDDEGSVVTTGSSSVVSFDPDVRSNDGGAALSVSSGKGTDKEDKWYGRVDEARIQFDIDEVVEAVRGGYYEQNDKGDGPGDGVGRYYGGEACLRGIEHLVSSERKAEKVRRKREFVKAVIREQETRGDRDPSTHRRAIAFVSATNSAAARAEAARIAALDEAEAKTILGIAIKGRQQRRYSASNSPASNLWGKSRRRDVPEEREKTPVGPTSKSAHCRISAERGSGSGHNRFTRRHRVSSAHARIVLKGKGASSSHLVGGAKQQPMFEDGDDNSIADAKEGKKKSSFFKKPNFVKGRKSKKDSGKKQCKFDDNTEANRREG
eukprot:CAMPEP_0197455536 /NCGR_PEP_ID=MMETSP1175-20131217/41035_1 /TAXON_ID=1003142 /ORGANISM="Triceratium dubium, Strain CCMP147" /LENGTH=324 /DNA_ID=CAMNT_0042989413 /DNA_START=37 /DNA_END=1012 /DNA_ORIENTATION=-